MAKSSKPKPAKSVKIDVKFTLRSTPKLLDIGLVDTAPWNPKEAGTEDQLAKLRESIKADQSAGVLVVRRKPDGRYESLDGNHRLVVLRGLGVEQVPVLDYGEISDAEAALVNYRLNAEWFKTSQTDQFKLIKSAVEELNLDLDSLSTVIPLTSAELNEQIILLDKFESHEDPDEVPLAPDVPKTKRGDVYALGSHRLMCGDSSSTKDLDTLLDGQPIHLVNTDPPYNVKVEPRSNNAIAAGNSSFKPTQNKNGPRAAKKMRAKDRPLANDFVSDAEFDRLLAAWFGNITRVLIPGGGFYIWGGYANCGNYPPVLKRFELYFAQAIIWIKEHPVLTRKDFMGNHEWCFYGWKEGAAHRFFGPANVPDTWSIKKVNPQSMVHLTEKPVELAKRAIEYSSRAGENVLDLFGGSGSTLVAAEMTGRRAYLMELDPAYCDVIVQRWENLTKKKSKLVSK